MKKLLVVALSLLILVVALSAMQETVLFEIPHGTGPGEIRTNSDFWTLLPGPFTMDDEGNFYICDFDNNRIQVFDKAGKFIRSIKTGRACNGFINYYNGKLYFSGILDNKYGIDVYDIERDSLFNYTMFNYEGHLNPTLGSFVFDNTLYVVTDENENVMTDDNNRIKIISQASYDTLLYSMIENVKENWLRKSFLKIVGNHDDKIYLYYRYRENGKEGQQTKQGIVEVDNGTLKTMSDKFWFEGFIDKPSDFYITKNGKLLGLIPILIETGPGGMGYDRLVKMKFQMIELMP